MKRTFRESRLANETSPYLLSHARNPVDWHPFGDEAFLRAKGEDKPIFLSIGYSACHWCHVMERESFEDESIAALMNAHFVCIKVDREERPDIDELYMSATVALTGSGGWPMSVFLTPDGEPFFAGTYFPPHDTGGRPGLSTLLEKVASLWAITAETAPHTGAAEPQNNRQELLAQAAQLAAHVKSGLAPGKSSGLSEDALRAACRALSQDFDAARGGFGRAPKFPSASSLALLLRQHRRTHADDLLQMVTRTLDAMMTGGMFDQLGGGFCRYSVDDKWLIPHFEKMLPDNALLTEAYVEAFQVTAHAPYRRVARETLDFLLREMQGPNGGFFSSIDADSEGEEGKFYVFSKDDVRASVREPFATHLCEFFGITDEGNFDGKSVLSTRRSVTEVSRELGLSEPALVTSLEEGKKQLLSARSKRVAPDVDDKVLTAWNGLTIRALAQAARAFSEQRYLEAAMRAADFLLCPVEDGGHRRADGGLVRTSRGGRAHIDGFLEDYAFVADGLLALYEAGGGLKYLRESIALCEKMLADFSSDGTAALCFTAARPNGLDGKDSSLLEARTWDARDSASSNGNAVAVHLLARLSVHTERSELRARAMDIARAFAPKVKRTPRAYTTLLCSLDFLLESPLEITLVGEPGSDSFHDLSQALGAAFLPGRVETRVTSAEAQDPLAPLSLARFEEGEAKVHLCQNSVCQAPVRDVVSLGQTLANLQENSPNERRRELGGERLGGRATPQGTRKVATQFGVPESSYNLLGELSVSRIGLGTYRVGLDHPGHRAAVKLALTSGVNLIDTSPSFALGDSERLIGEVLAQLVDSGEVTRDGVVLCSKVGVALGSEAESLAARQRKEGALPFTVPLTESAATKAPEEGYDLRSGAFCLEPDFLRAQIQGTLERLGVETLDICLIQSPERLLSAGYTRAQMKDALASAFATLEQEVSAGRVGSYGVLTNTATRPKNDPVSLSLPFLFLENKAETPNLRVLALPFNLVEDAALRDGILAQAKEADLSVLACRPLSALLNGALYRLADPAFDEATPPVLSSARYKVASLEAEFETTFAAQLRLSGKADRPNILPLSGALGQAMEQVQSLEQFHLAETTMLTPQIRKLLSQIDRAFAGPGEANWQKFRGKYTKAVGDWLAAVRHIAAEKNRTFLTSLEDKLDSNESAHAPELPAPEGSQVAPWSSRALAYVAYAPGVTSALVGLRTEAHVSGALSVLTSRK